MTFLDVWIGYAILGTAACSAVFVWAVRNKQFTDFDRARRIALGSMPTGTAEDRGRAGRADRAVLVALLVITVAAMAAAVFVGFTSR